MSSYEKLLGYRRETATLGSCASLLGWDQETYMPHAGTDVRADQLALLSGLAHRRATAKEYGDLLAAAEQETTGEETESERGATVREARREYDLAVKLPAKLVEEIAKANSLARHAWVDARKANDFKTFLPYLKRNFELAREKADALGYADQPYDALVDEYEPGETTASLNAILSPLREAHVELLQRIIGSDRPVDTGPVTATFPVDGQKAFARAATKEIGFDFGRGRIDVTAHPFCMGIWPNDVRLTSRYSESFFNEGFFGVMHEAGHGIYEQGLPAERFGSPLGESVSLGVHESQSRMWENFVGRSRGFWDHFYPRAVEAFPAALGGVEQENFYRAINEVKPSLIRVEADEVTYNLHIFLRFELEQALVSGALACEDLPGAWNETFKSYLNLDVPSDADGCMQDIHWSAGLIGYFATYALGNLYAAQLFEKAEADLGALQPQFARGEFDALRTWLNRNVHAHGKRLPPRRLIESITGKPPTHDALVRYLEGKYSDIYGL
ncbi:MAG: carboxypeptidase M32 [Planctomycetota bacterium]|jgi:carboxypeptidase Taq